MPSTQTYILNGLPIEDYTIPNASSGWQMIGGCSYPSRASVDSGEIRGIFRFTNGYKHLSAEDTLTPGEGYWINISSDATINVEMLD